MPSHDLDTYTHPDSRPNNPRAGLAHYDSTPDTPRTYSFDPHMSPSLEWAGKSEGSDFSVPTPSIHRHEVIRPHVIINSALRQEQQLSLFADASPYERLQERIKAIEAYQHSENWTNRLIAGDSLLVMNSLIQKEAMSGTVQTAYIDPPYGIKYGSNFQPFVNRRDVKDRNDDDLTQEPEMIKAFRDTWELGIHSYLTYLRNRLLLVREMLKDSGSVFVQISDENVHYVRCICDEIFGKENFITSIKFKKTGSISANFLGSTTDYIVWYVKDREQAKYHQLYIERKAGEPSLDMYNYVNCDGGVRRLTAEELHNPTLLSGLRNFQYTTLFSDGAMSNTTEPIEFEGEKFYPPKGKHWKTTREGMNNLMKAGRIEKSGKGLRYKRYLDDFPLMELGDIWEDTGGATDMKYVVQTSTKVIQRCILMTSDPGDLVLDITCGSGTTPYVAEQWGRRWIACDTSRVAVTIARQRLMTAAYDYYRLADDKKGISAGFVYKTVPHITLKSIANNEPPAREILYDAPEADAKRIRITGPFSVEGLPAPVVLSPDEAANLTADVNEGARQSDWRSQLLSAGIVGRKGERIRFSRVDALEGTRCLNAEAETEDGESAVVCFAGETTLMDSRRVYRALEEAVNRLPRPAMVIFAAFQFDAEASEMIRHLEIPQGMTALQVHMNADLMTADLKKNVRTEQSFFLVGQPDVVLMKSGNKYRVKVIGFDYYNVKTNKVESGEAENIAMWLLDTDYNGMTLNPSQIFFPMDGKTGGWSKLAKTLRTEIDPELIAQYAGNESLEFTARDGQKIAVKIIDDRGIESMRILEVRE